MDHLNKMLEFLKQNNTNSIELSKIYELDLDDKEFLSVLSYLEKNNIQIKNDIIPDNEYTNYQIKDCFNSYLNSIPKYPVLTREQENELFKRYSNGDMSAWKIIVNSNLKLVVAFAKRYNSIIKNKHLDLMDVIQEGNLGLMTALKKYDYTKGYKFSTYATWWIRQSMLRYLGLNGDVMKKPNYFVDKLNRIKKFKNEYYAKNGIEPTVEEISNDLNYTVDEIEKIIYYGQDTLSLDMPVSSEVDETTLADFISNNDDHETDIIMKYYFLGIIEKLRNELEDKELDVILKRFGVNEDKEMSLDQIGKIYNVSRERIRQIESRAMNKIRKMMILDPKYNEEKQKRMY